MIKKLIDRIIDKTSSGARNRKRLSKRLEFGPDGHGIDPALVDERALRVVRTLKDGGYEAYIVGGAVRDLLLGLKPKDFDVATSATPEEVKKLFRRAFIIGRRFRIVHVVFGRGRDHEVIEVSTFRASVDSADTNQVKGNERTARSRLASMKHAVDSSGRVLRDNVWGSQEQDAVRRDFTINALYYDPQDQIVVDYHGGIADARSKLLRMIGDPMTRYREDPVRVIRAVRFEAKLSALGFRLDPQTARPLVEAKALLADVPQSRLFDEMLKLLQTGHALASVEQLKKLGLGTGIYPLLDRVVERADHPFVHAALKDTDRRVAEDKPVAPSFLLAAVLWQDVLSGWQAREEAGEHKFPALQQAITDVFDARIGDVSGRGRLGSDMREIWMMQPRFERRAGKSPFRLIDQPRFRAGLDFMRLRVDIGEVDQELLDWWQSFSLANDATREDLVDALHGERQRAKRSSRGGRGGRKNDSDGTDRADAGHDEDFDDDASDDESETRSAPKKRRRRRRKPAGDANSGQAAEKGE